MNRKVAFENQTFSDEKQAVNALAFCHYPVEVSADDRREVFASFDDARRFVGEIFTVSSAESSDKGVE